MSYTTAKPEPAGHVEIDGVQHAVWSRENFPLASYEHFERVKEKALTIRTDADVARNPDVVEAFLRSHVPTLTELPFRGADVLRLLSEVMALVNPRLLALAKKAAAAPAESAAAPLTGSSTQTRSGRRSRRSTAGVTTT